MRRVIFLLLAAVATALVTTAFFYLPRLVHAEIGPYAIDIAAPAAVLLLLAGLVVLYVIARLLVRLLTFPKHWRRWRRVRARRRGERAVTAALVALAAGDGAGARHESARARRALGDTPQTLLLAAQAARQTGEAAEAAALFEALARHREASFLGLRGLFQQAVGRADWDQAARLARRAEAAFPGAAWLRRERLAMALRRGAWSEALALAGPDAPRAAFAAAAAIAAPDAGAAERLARRAFQDDPKLTAAALAYGERLRAAGKARAAAKMLRAAWAANPHPDLAAFALAPITDAMARFRAAGALVAGRAEDAESHLLLARTALDAGLIGQARHHAEAAGATLTQRRVFLLLAAIAEREAATGEHRAAAGEALQAALRQAAAADPDPTWYCDACAAPVAAWQPVCPACGAAGRVVWGAAPRAATRSTRPQAEHPANSTALLTPR